MAYNIDSIDYINGGPLLISTNDYDELSATLDTPEICFLSYDETVVASDEHPGLLQIVSPWWSGEGSGRRLDDLLVALSHTTGEADLLITWEGGDSFSGYRVRDGVVTEHEIVQSLGAVILPR